MNRRQKTNKKNHKAGMIGTVSFLAALAFFYAVENVSAASMTRYPSGDGDKSGTWTYTSGSTGWNLVDETSVDDNDYVACPTTGTPYYNFTFSAFDVPIGSSINNLTVYVRSRDVTSGSNSTRPKIKVNGTQYNTTSGSNNPGTSFNTYNYVYATNPNTGAAWTVADINGTGASPFQQFGVYHSDCNPAIRTSWIYAVVNYDDPAALSISAPDNITVAQNSSYNIAYTLTDSDSVATAAFYYDVNTDMNGGTAISGACATAAEGTGVTCSWDTTGVTPGTYYVYGVTNTTPVAISGLSPGTITITAAGSVSADIVDGSGNPVSSPSVTFVNKSFDWSAQQSTGILGTASQKIRITSTLADWTLAIAATSGPTALWNGGGNNYDFNGSASAGNLQINASVGTITPQDGCSVTGISKGPATYFAQGSQDSVTLLTGSSAQTGCYWDFTGVGLTQNIPASQAMGNYSIGMALTAS